MLKLALLMVMLNTMVCPSSPSRIYIKCESSIAKIDIWVDKRHGSGSGVIVAPGIIVTCAHVLRDTDSVVVSIETWQKWVLPKDIILIDGGDSYDIAFIYLKTLPYKPLDLGINSEVKIGDTVYTLGCPFGIIDFFACGNYNGLKDGFVYYTAPISPGSSGGALLDIKGKLLGITCSYMADSENINRAIPIETVKQFLPTVIEEFKRRVK